MKKIHHCRLHCITDCLTLKSFALTNKVSFRKLVQNQNPCSLYWKYLISLTRVKFVKKSFKKILCIRWLSNFLVPSFNVSFHFRCDFHWFAKKRKLFTVWRNKGKVMRQLWKLTYWIDQEVKFTKWWLSCSYQQHNEIIKIRLFRYSQTEILLSTQQRQYFTKVFTGIPTKLVET